MKLKEKDLEGAKDLKNNKGSHLQKNALNRTKTLKNEPFAKLVSREQANLLHSKEKLNDKRFGMYHPRYNLVFKYFALLFRIQK